MIRVIEGGGRCELSALGTIGFEVVKVILLNLFPHTTLLYKT